MYEEKHAIEYMENDLMNSEKLQKGKVHYVSKEPESRRDREGYSELQERLDRQEAELQQVLAECDEKMHLSLQ